jgi:hypothetical protein
VSEIEREKEQGTFCDGNLAFSFELLRIHYFILGILVEAERKRTRQAATAAGQAAMSAGASGSGQ